MQRAAQEFTYYYYNALSKKSEDIEVFYTDKSNCSFTAFSGEQAEVQKGIEGISNIAKKFEKVKIEIESVDSQESLNGGMLIAVLGSTIQNDTYKRFSQTFFLEKEHDSFYVLNDIFRYYGEEEKIVEEKVNHTAPETQKAEPVKETRAPEPAQPAQPEKTQPKEATPAPPADKPANAAVAAASAAPASETTAPATSAAPAPQPKAAEKTEEKKKEVPSKPEPAKPKSWASIVTRTPEESDKPAAKPAAKSQQPQQQQQQQPKQEKTADKKDEKPKSADGCSLYVSNLPIDTTYEQLSSAVAGYGKPKYIAVKGHKGFAFIEYDTPAATQSAFQAIQAKPIVIGGQVAKVEERKPRGPPREGGFNRDAGAPGGGQASFGRGAGRGRGFSPQEGQARDFSQKRFGGNPQQGGGRGGRTPDSQRRPQQDAPKK